MVMRTVLKSAWCWIPPSGKNEGEWSKVEDRCPIEVVHGCFVNAGGESGLPTDVVILIHREDLDAPMPSPSGTGRRAKKRARLEAAAAAEAKEEEWASKAVDDADDKDKESESKKESDKSSSKAGSADTPRSARAGESTQAKIDRSLDDLAAEDHGEEASDSAGRRSHGRGQG